MCKIIINLAILTLLYCPFRTHAQQITLEEANELVEKEQHGFLNFLGFLSKDTNIINYLPAYFEQETNTIQQSVINDSTLSEKEKAKAIQSLVFLMRGLIRHGFFNRTEIYDIPGLLADYKAVLEAIVHHKSYSELLQPVSARRTRLLSLSFWQYDECALLEDISTYKSVLFEPEFILEFLELSPAFRFTDSLLLMAVLHDPAKVISYMQQPESVIRAAMDTTNNIYLRQLLLLSQYNNARELYPFLVPLTEKKGVN
jgi:hypothetical protein